MLRNRKGMTLVEMVVAIAILAIAGLILATGFSTVIRHVGEATTIKNVGNEMFTTIESDVQENKKNKDVNITISFSDGSKIEDTITLTTTEKKIDDSNDAYKTVFHKFTKGVLEVDPSRNYYEKVVDAMEFTKTHAGYHLIYNERLAELKKNGISFEGDLAIEIGGGYENNTNFNKYFYLVEIYPDFFPTLDESVIKGYNKIILDEQSKGAPGASTMLIGENKKIYMKPYFITSADEILLAVDTVGQGEKKDYYRIDQWRTPMVYVPDENSWYAKIYKDGTNGWYRGLTNLNTIELWSRFVVELTDTTQWKKIEIN